VSLFLTRQQHPESVRVALLKRYKNTRCESQPQPNLQARKRFPQKLSRLGIPRFTCNTARYKMATSRSFVCSNLCRMSLGEKIENKLFSDTRRGFSWRRVFAFTYPGSVCECNLQHYRCGPYVLTGYFAVVLTKLNSNRSNTIGAAAHV